MKWTERGGLTGYRQWYWKRFDVEWHPMYGGEKYTVWKLPGDHPDKSAEKLTTIMADSKEKALELATQFLQEYDLTIFLETYGVEKI